MSHIPLYNALPGHPLSRCSAVDSDDDRCVKYASHAGSGQDDDHRDKYGYEWPPSPAEVRAATESGQAAQAREDQLRHLVSYCRSAADGNRSETDLEASGAHTAYGDVADKLTAILDGES